MKFLIALLAGMLVLGGCRAPTIDSVLSPADDAFAKDYLRMLGRGDIDRAEAMVSAELRDENTWVELRKMAAILNRGDPDFIEPIGVQVHTTPSSRIVNISYQLRYDREWYTANVAKSAHSGMVTVQGVSVQPSPGDLRELNRFTVRGAGGRHVGVLLLALLSISSAVAAAIAALRSTIPKKWAWAALALVGVGTVQLNWATGAMSALPLHFLLLGAGFTKGSEFSPWIISAAFPLGAVITWRRIRRGPVPAVDTHGDSAVFRSDSGPNPAGASQV
jgi:hypothetical protein